MPCRSRPRARTLLAIVLVLAPLAGCVSPAQESRGSFEVITPVPYEPERPLAGDGGMLVGLAALVGEAWYDEAWNAQRAGEAFEEMALDVRRVDTTIVVADAGNATRVTAAADEMGDGTRFTVIFEHAVPAQANESVSALAQREWALVEDDFTRLAHAFGNTTAWGDADESTWSYVLYAG